MAQIFPLAFRNPPLFAITKVPPLKDSSLTRIAFLNFEEQKYWVRARLTAPNYFKQHQYTRVSVHLDQKEKSIWIFEADLVDRFFKMTHEIQGVTQHIPKLLYPLIHRLVPECTKNKFEKGDLETMFRLGKFLSLSPEVQCIKKEAPRTLIAGQGRSYILFTKCNREKDRFIGSGSCKRVKTAIGIDSANIYAVGICRRNLIDPADWDSVINEIEILKRMRNVPGILQLETAIITEEKIYIITEFFNRCDLQGIFDQNEPFNFKDKLQIALDISLGLLNMHSLKIVHRDLKPSNLLISIVQGPSRVKTIRAVIGDLGGACYLDDRRFLHKRTGTIGFMAPEKIGAATDSKRFEEWGENCTPEADVWSLGLIFFSLFHPITGTLMNFQRAKNFESELQKLTFEAIQKELESSQIDPSIYLILLKMLSPNPRERSPMLWIYQEIEKLFEKTD